MANNKRYMCTGGGGGGSRPAAARNEEDPAFIREMLSANPDQLALLKQVTGGRGVYFNEIFGDFHFSPKSFFCCLEIINFPLFSV